MNKNEYKEIIKRLDKIIALLELRNSISQARNEMLLGCSCHLKGRSTADTPCPVHG